MNRFVSALALIAILNGCEKESSYKAPAPSTAAAQQSSAVPASAAPSDPMREGTEKLFHNPFDTDAVYLLSQKTGTPEALAILVKRVSQSGVQYSRWLFNCKEQTAQNLGVAESIQALDLAANSMPSKSQHYELKSKIGAVAEVVCQ